MPVPTNRSSGDVSRITTDVLILGGGPAGAWAALAAARAGARVVLADKGYLGTSGATAPSNTGPWCVPPGDARTHVVARRWARTGGLGDQRWMLRCVDTAYEKLMELSDEGYPFPSDDHGELYIANLRGPDYMHFMRRRVLKAGVTVLDHHPALELTAHGGTIAGARGIDRQRGHEWQVDAGAVVLATGGCAFFERILGGTGLTGDGYLMAAEAGARLSGMEFTGKYTLSPYGSSLNKGVVFRWARFSHEDGTPIRDADGDPLTGAAPGYETALARALIAGPVFARLDLADPVVQHALRNGQPNCFLPHDRARIDPFADRFRVVLRAEGTVRGTGGLRIATGECGTDVPGLYAAGDAASRELMTGAVSGGGAVNASWAIASGSWSGLGAARYALRAASRGGDGDPRPLGRAGLRPHGDDRHLDPQDVITAVRAEVIPLDRNYFRSGSGLRESGARLDTLWSDVSAHLRGDGVNQVRAREVASVLASARWSITAALARTESRGMHRRIDLPETDPAQTCSILVSGIDSPVAAFDAPQAQVSAS